MRNLPSLSSMLSLVGAEQVTPNSEFERNSIFEGCSLPGGPGGVLGWGRHAGDMRTNVGQGVHAMPAALTYDWAQSAPDVALMVALREARQRFVARLAAIAENREAFDRLIGTQRDLVFIVAEFYFALRAMKISSAGAIKAFIDNHNRHIRARLEAEFRKPDGSYLVGGLADRLKQGIFGPAAIRMIEITLSEQRQLKLSQSDLARFLVEVMSDETARKVLSALCDAGLLAREREPVNNAVLIWSENEVLETAFGQHLAEIRSLAASLA